MKSLLKNIDVKNLYEIYSNLDNTDKFLVGFVEKYDEEFVVVENINSYGNSDGWSCFRIDDIIQYKKNSKYLKSIEKLYLFNKNKRNYLLLNNSDELIFAVLYCIKESGLICAIELCNSQLQDVLGHILEVDKKANKIIIETVDDYGQRDGEAIIDVFMISNIEFKSADTQKIDILYSLNN